MGREYSNKRSSRKRTSASRQFLVTVLVFLLGYLAATVCDIHTLTQWINNQVLAHQETNKTTLKPQAKTKETALTKPKFEFYTLLANEKVPNSHEKTSNNQVAANTTVTNNAASVQAAVNTAQAVTNPQPLKLTITNQQQAATGAKPVSLPGTKGEAYSVQVASFKARQDAEHMKGALILKGFNVSVVPINHASKGSWFRVVVGPYANRGLAQRAQLDLAKNEHLRGMITSG